jgi:hypothetical protein
MAVLMTAQIPGGTKEMIDGSGGVRSDRRSSALGNAAGTLVNQALKSGWNRNYPETVPFGSSSDVK